MTDRTNAELGSVPTPGQGSIQGMDWIWHTAKNEGKVDLGITGEHPSLTSTAPNVTEGRAGNSSVDRIGNLPWHLWQTETGVQDRIQATPPIDNRCNVDHFPIGADDAVFVQENLPMLVVLLANGHLRHRELRHQGDILEAGDEFADGDIARIEIRGIVRPAKQGSEVIGRGCV